MHLKHPWCFSPWRSADCALRSLEKYETNTHSLIVDIKPLLLEDKSIPNYLRHSKSICVTVILFYFGGKYLLLLGS